MTSLRCQGVCVVLKRLLTKRDLRKRRRSRIHSRHRHGPCDYQREGGRCLNMAVARSPFVNSNVNTEGCACVRRCSILCDVVHSTDTMIQSICYPWTRRHEVRTRAGLCQTVLDDCTMMQCCRARGAVDIHHYLEILGITFDTVNILNKQLL